jgi:glycosyltransferase involved in cell wall biosynthesis
MRILMVTPYFPPAWPYGGPPRVVYGLSKALVSMGHDVTVYTTDAKGPKERCATTRENLDGIEVLRFRNLSNYLAWQHQLFLSPSMKTHLTKRMSEFDIVHFHTYRTYQNLIGFRLAKRNGVPIVLTPHGTLGRISRKKMLKALFDVAIGQRMLRSLALAVALSENETRELQEFGLDESRIRIIPNGIDPSWYETLPAPNEFSSQYGFDGRRFVTYVGRLHRMKGLEHLIRAFSDVRRHVSNLDLVLVGPDEGYQSTLRKLCVELGIEPWVHFLGFVDFPVKLSVFVDSEVVVYPASNEVFGLVPLESILCMTPVVVSEDAGCSSLIRQLGVGETAPYGDVKTLSERIQSVIGERRTMESALERGRQFLLTQMTWDVIAREVAAAYACCLKRLNRAI